MTKTRKPRKWNVEKLKSVLPFCKNVSDVIRSLGLNLAGGNHRTIKKYIQEFELDISHFDPKECYRRTNKKRTTPFEEILVKNSSYKNRQTLKRRLLRAGLLKEVCYECGLESIWNNKPITLQLDHINGIYNDHRLENLRLLCPNCHSQTENFAGKSSFKQRRVA